MRGKDEALATVRRNAAMARLVAVEPFAVMLPDDLFDAPRPSWFFLLPNWLA
jgi:hypothetical protein